MEPKVEPKIEPKIPPKAAIEEPPLVEPDRPPPSGPLPDQPRPGDPDKKLDRSEGRSVGELVNAYRRRLESTVEPWLGTPYSWGGTSKGTGTDCSGFTKGVYTEAFAIELPRVSRDQYRTGSPVAFELLRPGDLVFFDTADAGKITHVGVFAGDGKFAHASSGRGVIYEKLGEKYYKRAYRGARRLLAYPD
ncbi:NlpC/P60 family protein [Myxococcota bacterium]|nr:NlpC/P60 family protein [Myxococcota bacterium]